MSQMVQREKVNQYFSSIFIYSSEMQVCTCSGTTTPVFVPLHTQCKQITFLHYLLN